MIIPVSFHFAEVDTGIQYSRSRSVIKSTVGLAHGPAKVDIDILSFLALGDGDLLAPLLYFGGT